MGGEKSWERNKMLWAVWVPMMRRQESCLGCVQMLVAVPAGGGWAHLSLALPVSLFSAVEKATDGVRRFCSGPSSASSVHQALSLPQPQPQGSMPGEHGDHARSQPSTTTRVNCLQRGVALPPGFPTNTLLPPGGCKQQLHICVGLLFELRHCFLQTKTCPFKVSQWCQLWSDQDCRLHVSGSFFTKQ